MSSSHPTASVSSLSTNSPTDTPLRAALVVTGEELLRGVVADVNGSTIAASLSQAGAEVSALRIVGDRAEDIAAEITALAESGVDLIVVSGGLGGTHDDCTMEAVASSSGRQLVASEQALGRALDAYGSLMPKVSRTTRAMARKQALLPDGATLLPAIGTAPGCVTECGDALVCVLPGPPWECASMWRSALAAQPLRGLLGAASTAAHADLRVRDAVESEFVQYFEAIPAERREGVRVGVCARDGELEITLRDEIGTPGRLDRISEALSEGFGERLYTYQGLKPAEALLATLRDVGETLSVAESCTGGGAGALLTDVAGASDVFLGGLIAYGNSVKETLLGVPGSVLDAHGAVSEETAAAMADGARRLTGSDWGLAITGIAGPGGGTAEKPVGLVWVSVRGPRAEATRRLDIRGDRARIRRRAASAALHLAREAAAGAPRT